MTDLADDSKLAPPETFIDRRGNARVRADCGIVVGADEIGPNSRTVARRIASACAGWRRPPTPREFFDAVRTDKPSPRQAGIITMWLREATDDDLILAWAEEAYTFRQLAHAIHRSGAENSYPERNRDLNRLSER